MLYCVDLSKWQDPAKINYENLTKHAPMIVCRLACGTELDTSVEKHVSSLLNTGRDPYGYYFYIKGTTTARVETEIDYAVFQLERILNKYNLNYCAFLAMDIESASGKAFENKPGCVAKLMNYLESKLKEKRLKVKAGLYTNASRLDKWLTYSPVLQHYYIWVAAYLSKEDFKKRYPVAFKCGHMWQYTSQGSFSCAYDGRLDVNYLNYEGGAQVDSYC